MREQLSIALMSSQSSWGGGEQFLWSLGHGLIQRGHRILWVAPGDSDLMRRAREMGYDSMAMRRRPSPLSMYTFRKKLVEHQVQILHLNDSHAITWGSLSTIARCNLPRVAVKHTVFPIRSSAKYNWFVERFICVSEAAKAVCLAGGILERKLQVISGGVEPREFDRESVQHELKLELGIASNTKLLVAVGSLIPCKGYIPLLHSIQKLVRNQVDVFLVICGEGSMRRELEKQIERLELTKNVRLVGFREDVDRWIAGADLFVHAALSEGLSLVTIQAQMAGTPVVVTDVGGLAEVMRSPTSGEHLGWLVEPDHPVAMARAIQEALEQPDRSNSMAERAKRWALDRYSLDRMVSSYEASFLELVQQRRHRAVA